MHVGGGEEMKQLWKSHSQTLMNAEIGVKINTGRQYLQSQLEHANIRTYQNRITARS